jgi:hypothetical protein
MHGRYTLVFSYRSVMGQMLAICIALSLGAIPALPKDNAGIVPPGNWAAVESLQKGTSISVRMTSSDRMDGKFRGLDTEGIHLTIDNQERVYPRNSIAEVWQLRVWDRKLNGTLIGMFVGALAGVAGAGTSKAPFTGEDKVGVLFVGAGIGLGALIGATTDALIKSDRLLYRK